MFEFEVDHGVGDSANIPDTVKSQFFRHDLQALTLLAWEEHCTECAMPQCYSSCDLYHPRKDGKCRRFHQGFEYIALAGKSDRIARVSFKRWGKVLAYGNLHLVPRRRAQRVSAALDRVAEWVGRLPDGNLSIAGRRALSSRLVRQVKKRVTRFGWFSSKAYAEPTSFVLEVYNPQAQAVSASFVIRDEGPLDNRPFQELIVVEPGFNRVTIPFERIKHHIDASRLFTIGFCPNLAGPEDEGLALYFGMMSFVAEQHPRGASLEHTYRVAPLPEGAKHVKAVAWDLDNTVWKGILLEDGEQNLTLRPQILDVMQELDRRGIINSIVSKNDPTPVEPLLKKFGIHDYVVFPKIGWMPKSESVKELVASLNIGAETVVVVDDSPFERQEISQRCPGVRVFPETEYLEILRKPEFCPPLSAESSKRRAFYRAEEQRSAVASANAGSYEEFLRECHIEMHVQRVDSVHADRVHELIQRTNQLNFSGNRYTRDQVEAFLQRDELLPISLSCKDSFGDYGLVGFCLYDMTTHTINDLMFSCRVQAKTVEHAFLRRLALLVKAEGAPMLKARYKKTAKNVQAAKVFDDLGFQLLEANDDNALYLYGLDLADLSPRDEIIVVNWDVAP